MHRLLYQAKRFSAASEQRQLLEELRMQLTGSIPTHHVRHTPHSQGYKTVKSIIFSKIYAVLGAGVSIIPMTRNAHQHLTIIFSSAQAMVFFQHRPRSRQRRIGTAITQQPTDIWTCPATMQTLQQMELQSPAGYGLRTPKEPMRMPEIG